ncbi:MAG TPA: hypothetical protein VK817_06170 [Trebonia sp.]|jgi:hypothetical protein|nr:hypothetical protein [Trebonia sp.]
MTTQRARAATPSVGRPGPAHAAPGVKYGPWLCALIAAAAATVLVIARWATWAKHNIGNFILVGQHFANPAQVPRGIPIQPTYGYDGQYFYRLALDPADLSHTAFGISVDHSYRFMRIGYPLLTWLLSGGQHSVVPDVLIVVNILAVGALGYLGAVFAADGGRNALWGLLVPCYFGIVTSVSRDTAEPLAAACLLAGLVAMRRRRPVLAGVLLAYGALTRETAMVGVGAIAIMRVLTMVRERRAPGREDVAWVLPSVVFVAWQVVIYAVTGSVALATDGGRNAGLPFSAPVHALLTNLRHINSSHFDQYDLWLLELGALVLCCVAAIVTIRASKAPSWEKLAFLLYVVEICLVNPNTWNSLDADMRSFIEVYLMAVILLLSVPAGQLGARFGWVLPVIGVWVLAAIAGVVQRRLTISFGRLESAFAGPRRRAVGWAPPRQPPVPASGTV